MPEPTARAHARSYPDSDYCDRWDLLVGLDGLHVINAAEREGRRGVSCGWWSSHRHGREGCWVCGVIAHSHGRRTVLV
jgi:transposase